MLQELLASSYFEATLTYTKQYHTFLPPCLLSDYFSTCGINGSSLHSSLGSKSLKSRPLGHFQISRGIYVDYTWAFIFSYGLFIQFSVCIYVKKFFYNYIIPEISPHFGGREQAGHDWAGEIYFVIAKG